MESINHTQAYYNQELKSKIKNIILKVDNKEGQFVYRGRRIQKDFFFFLRKHAVMRCWNTKITYWKEVG